MLGCSNRRGVRHEGVHEESEFPRPSFDRISKVTARVLGRACARGRRWKWTSGIRRVIVQTFRGKTALPCLPIAQPDGPVFGERSRSKAKGDRCPLDRKKNDPLTLRAVARGHENRASIDLSFLLSSGGEKRPIRSSNSRGFSVIVSESSTNN